MLPALKTPDSSIDLLREGYTFIPRRCDQLGTDGFRTRLLFKPVTCIHGADAAGMFYNGHRFTRQGAFPTSIMHLLQDEGSVQALDGDAHHHRKAGRYSAQQYNVVDGRSNGRAEYVGAGLKLQPQSQVAPEVQPYLVVRVAPQPHQGKNVPEGRRQGAEPDHGRSYGLDHEPQVANRCLK